MNRFLKILVLFCVFYGVVNTSYAAQEEALEWLASNQSSIDGSISNEIDIANVLQSSFESARTLLLSAEEQYETQVQLAIDFLSSDNVDNHSIESLSNLILLKELSNIDIESETTELLQRIENKKGVGLLNQFNSNPTQELWALQALSGKEAANSEASLLIGLVSSVQTVEGDFITSKTDDASIHLSSQNITALNGYRSVFDINSSFDRSISVLNSFKQPSGHWDDTYYNSLALLALVPSAIELTDLQASIDQLRNSQLDNGSWENDVYKTALAARALILADNFTPPVEITTGKLIGQVVNSRNGQPLEGVSITAVLAGQEDVVVSSDAQGAYQFDELESGNYELQFSLSGYISRSLNRTVEARGVVNIGFVTLDSSVSAIQGRITSLDNNEPIENAVIAITGSTTTSINSDANGEYFVVVNQGELTINVSAIGFKSVGGTGTVGEGDTIDFSPQLVDENSTEPVVSDVFGIIVDQETGEPLSNAVITVVGQNLSIESNAQGEFSFSEFDEGAAQLSISKSGYVTSTYDFVVPSSTSVNVGELRLVPREVISSSSVFGVVSDADTGVPLANVEMNILDQTVFTGADGSYVLQGIDALNFQVSASLTGYFTEISNILLQEPSDTPLDVELRKISLLGLEIESVQTDEQEYSAYMPVVLTTNIVNKSDRTQLVKALFEIKNSDGGIVFGLPLSGDGAGQENSKTITIIPDDSESISTEWFTGIEKPGNYTLVVRIFDDTTNQLLAQQETTFDILETKEVPLLELNATPLFAGVGEEVQVTFDLRAINRSNAAFDMEVEYQWFDPQGEQLRSATEVISFVPEKPETTVQIDSFPYTFVSSGKHPATLNILEGPPPSELTTQLIEVAPSVRIEASQDITPKKVLPNGDKRIKLNIRIQGVEQ